MRRSYPGHDLRTQDIEKIGNIKRGIFVVVTGNVRFLVYTCTSHKDTSFIFWCLFGSSSLRGFVNDIDGDLWLNLRGNLY
jgi:hypothetical protein